MPAGREQPECAQGSLRTPGEPEIAQESLEKWATEEHPSLQKLRKLRGTTATLKAPEKATSEKSQESPRKLRETGEKTSREIPRELK